MGNVYVLDACALVTLLNNETGADVSDHHEFDALDGALPIKFHWTR